MTMKRGRELKPGDTIRVWWTPGRDTIVKLTPYTGPLARLYPDGAVIAEFALLPGGMTLDLGGWEEVVPSLASTA